MKKQMISFVIPCYKSEKTVGDVVAEISQVVAGRNVDFEVILVNDCSPDNTWEALLGIAKKNKHVKLINLACNAGRSNAILAGLSRISGDYVCFCDDDGQCPVDNFWKLYDEVAGSGHDFASAKYTEYKQSEFKDFGTRFNRLMTEKVLGKPKNVVFSNFSVMKRFVADRLAGARCQYLEGYALKITNDIVNVEMEERARTEGESTFTFSKLVNLFMDGMINFSVIPLRFAGFFGGISLLIGFVFMVIAIVSEIVDPLNSQIFNVIMMTVLYCSGVILLSLWLVGEYVGRVLISQNELPRYSIKEEVGFKK